MESYKHIELTQEETDEAILQAKQKKERLIIDKQNLERINENRKNLTTTLWSYEVTYMYMKGRAYQLFGNKFEIDKANELVFKLLCWYFSNDTDFVHVAENFGVENPSFNKGILLAGTYGTGKTWMMKVFQKNKINCFAIRNAKQIAAEFQEDGHEAVSTYQNKIKNAANDASMFYQPFCGLCIDDLGTEEIKNNFGNKSNVIGDLIEMRYAKGNAGIYLHATTNLDAEGITNFYGGRVASRMREIFNIIELNGTDRRK